MNTHNDQGFAYYWAQIKNYVEKAIRSHFALTHPVGTVYITATNVNPGSYLGGTWTLIKRTLKNASVDDAVTWNTTNTVASSQQSVFWVRDTRVTFRIRFSNKVAISDSTLTMGTIDLSKLGLSGHYYGVYTGLDDTANAGIMMDIQTNNGTTEIRTIDVIGGGTVAASTATSPTITVCGELMFDTSSIQDSMCSMFHWRRTA